ncbi:MAG: ADP-glyceromanno-heptose 6-epimerase [Desulfovibrionaceae bacterium]|nr:ADP-glyceromanno-heptose 6-epimerase [Desulfovibrionaceae bacterium]
MHIVTGGAGFIGSAMVWKLNRMGVDDILVVDDLASSEKWRNLVNLRYQDYLHKDQFYKLIVEGDDPFETESVIHMGACSSTTETDADHFMDNNYRYSQMLCRFALNNDLRFINASSAATYGDGSRGFSDDHQGLVGLRPMNMYGYSKHLFDLWALRAGVLDRLASLKFFNVFGPNEYHKGEMTSVVCKAFDQIRETGALRLFRSRRPDYAHGGQMRDFVYVKDCVEVMAWLLEHPEANGVFNVGTGIARTWNNLAKAVFKAMGVEPRLEYVDMPEAIRDKYQYFTQADMGKLAKAGCDVAMTPLEDAVSDYVGSYLAAQDRHLG